MWQRIQTVFLLVVVISMIGVILMPIWVYQPETENSHMLFALHYTEKTNGVANTMYMPFAITAMFAVACATVAVISIRKYNNRMLQLKLGVLNSLLMVGVIGCAFYFALDLAKTAPNGRFGAAVYMLVAGVISNFLANRFIKRDEKLVRDSDRLR